MNLSNPIAKGNTAEIYLYDGRIIKVFHDQLPEGEAAYEAGKQRIAHFHGLPVPQIIDVTHISGKQAIVMEYVKGVAIGDLMQQNESDAEFYLALSVDLQIEMHSKPAAGIESMRDKLTPPAPKPELTVISLLLAIGHNKSGVRTIRRTCKRTDKAIVHEIL